MDIWYAKAAVLAGAVAMIAIRAPHGQRSRGVKVAKRRVGPLERVLLVIAMGSFFLSLLWVAAPRRILGFADYALLPVPYACGVVCLAVGLWLFHRSHADLGTNWSVTLEVREGHTLVTHGVYGRIRHPMYSALLLFSVGQALVLPNWVAGPSYLVAMALLFALRVGPEERMMRDEFGVAYTEYAARTKRLVPGVW
jgi:protein-S-isoprenylcysteine O-methyltransferase Ste14